MDVWITRGIMIFLGLAMLIGMGIIGYAYIQSRPVPPEIAAVVSSVSGGFLGVVTAQKFLGQVS